MTHTATRRRLHLATDVTAGPAVARQRRRAYALWAVVALIGLVPTLLDAGVALRAGGLGLWFPGAGFLADGAWWWSLVTLVLFAVALAGWLGVGGFVFPVGVWLGSAVLAAMSATDVDGAGAIVVATTAGAALLGRAVGGVVLARTRRRQAIDLAAHLAGLEVRTPPFAAGAAGELDEEDLAAARYVYDLALQPIDAFEGFTTIDQFREAAWRYQLVSINYALASLQVNYAPAFRGYLLDAQANAVTKMLDRRAWHYWRIENLIGNLRIGADPVRSENIMLSGWWALALGAFENATGDRRFSAPGALTFRESEHRAYAYDYPTLVDSLVRQFDERELCFFPCEPNWVFAICNLFGLTGVLSYDRAHGTDHARDRVDRFTRTLEREYTTADGRFVLISSRRTGLRVTSASPISPSSLAWLTNMLSPRLAQTYWEIGLRTLRAGGGSVADYVVPTGFAVDPGNYRATGAYFWAALMLSAREMGDAETYREAADRMTANGRTVEGGVLRYRGSTYANLTAHAGRFGSEGTWHRFAWGTAAPAPADSPHLARAAYPRVQVARAVTDGAALEAVLRPGCDPGPASVVVGGLVPGGRYVVSADGAGSREEEVDAFGRLDVPLLLDGRTELRVTPRG